MKYKSVNQLLKEVRKHVPKKYHPSVLSRCEKLGYVVRVPQPLGISPMYKLNQEIDENSISGIVAAINKPFV